RNARPPTARRKMAASNSNTSRSPTTLEPRLIKLAEWWEGSAKLSRTRGLAFQAYLELDHALMEPRAAAMTPASISNFFRFLPRLSREKVKPGTDAVAGRGAPERAYPRRHFIGWR